MIGVAVRDPRLTLAEVRDIARALVNGFCENPRDEKSVHAGRLLTDTLVQSRGERTSSRWSDDDEDAEMQESVLPSVKVTAGQVVKALAKVEGVVELPEPGTAARRIIDADRRRNEPL
jgi:hypothetical protein